MRPKRPRTYLPPVATLAAGALVALFVAGCVTGDIGTSGAADLASAPRSQPDAAEGNRLYYTRCTSCHAAEPVDYYTRAEWTTMVDHMRKRAKLKPQEEADLLAFLHANAAE